jgi:hypothetical protein
MKKKPKRITYELSHENFSKLADLYILKPKYQLDDKKKNKCNARMQVYLRKLGRSVLRYNSNQFSGYSRREDK